MTTASAKTESTLDGVKSILRMIWAAFLTAALTVSFVISFTTIIYGGSLSPLLETGLGLSLLGAALMCGVGGFFYSFRGTICHPQDVTAIVLAVSASAMADTWPADQGDSLMATIAMLIAVTTAFSGLVAWGFGVLRLGFRLGQQRGLHVHVQHARGVFGALGIARHPVQMVGGAAQHCCSP